MIVEVNHELVNTWFDLALKIHFDLLWLTGGILTRYFAIMKIIGVRSCSQNMLDSFCETLIYARELHELGFSRYNFTC